MHELNALLRFSVSKEKFFIGYYDEVATVLVSEVDILYLSFSLITSQIVALILLALARFPQNLKFSRSAKLEESLLSPIKAIHFNKIKKIETSYVLTAKGSSIFHHERQFHRLLAEFQGGERQAKNSFGFRCY